MMCAWQKHKYHISWLEYINGEEHLKENNIEVDPREGDCEDVH
jgi:hypothetical protein